jgi:hypothetical protein
MRFRPNPARDKTRSSLTSERWVQSSSLVPGGGLPNVRGYRHPAPNGVLACRKESFDLVLGAKRLLTGLICALVLSASGCTTDKSAALQRDGKTGLRAKCTGNEYMTGPVFAICSAP